MPDIDGLVNDVERAPDGPQVGAFFDFDGTLIDGYSAKVYFQHRIKNREIGVRELGRTVVESVNVEARGRDVTRLMELGVGALAGRSVEDMDAFGDRLFRTKIAGMVYPDARVLLDAHRRKGHTIAIASSATPFQVHAAALDLGIDNVLCTKVDAPGGILNGRVLGPVLWGEAKAEAVRSFAADRGVDLTESFAYGNGGEDVAFLETVGRPRPLNPDSDLVESAHARGWRVARLTKVHRHTPLTAARSLMAYGGLGAGVALGIGLGLLNRDRRTALEVAASVGSELSLAAAGVNLRVVGQENLWAARPAVFTFNHQSQLDVLVLSALLRSDFTGVAKKELATDPMFAPLGWLADVAYVDRSNTVEAKKALAPAVESLRSGRSLVIAPEGTRSATPRLLPFKKGAFHVAIQAKVPVVPIVIRNAGELLPAHATLIAAGDLDVAVLPPVDTSRWKAKTIGAHVEAVRQMYLDTLADWPGGG